MPDFTYVRPDTLDEALAFLHAHAGAAKPCAGGTDLMVALRAGDPRLDQMEYLLDLSALFELTGVTRTGGTLCIGPCTTHAAVSREPLLPTLLRNASGSVGAQQTRNAGTIGGNVVNAAVAADTLSPLAALDAEVVLRAEGGTRRMPLVEFVTGAGKTCIRPDELLTSIEFAAIDGEQTAFVKLGRRKALAISRMNTAAGLLVEDGVIRCARIAAGCVFAAPRRSARAEALVIGQKPSAALFLEAGRALADEMIEVTGVRWSTKYKQPALMAVVQSALCAAAGIGEDIE